MVNGTSRVLKILKIARRTFTLIYSIFNKITSSIFPYQISRVYSRFTSNPPGTLGSPRLVFGRLQVNFGKLLKSSNQLREIFEDLGSISVIFVSHVHQNHTSRSMWNTAASPSRATFSTASLITPYQFPASWHVCKNLPLNESTVSKPGWNDNARERTRFQIYPIWRACKRKAKPDKKFF